jgi:hypothetical protein
VFASTAPLYQPCKRLFSRQDQNQVLLICYWCCRAIYGTSVNYSSKLSVPKIWLAAIKRNVEKVMSWFKKIFGRQATTPESTKAQQSTSASEAIEAAVVGNEMPEFEKFPNPGIGATLQVAFSNAERSWSENVDLVELLSAVLAKHLGHCDRDGDTLRSESGLYAIVQNDPTSVSK